MEHPGSWDKNLPCAEFSYNNNYQESLKMAPFEVLYGRRCRTPLNWTEPGEKAIFGPNLVEEAKATVNHIQENIRAARLRQECEQEAPTFRVHGWGSCVSQGFNHDGHEKIRNKRKTSTSLYWTISHP
jgi:hypothetical protein